MGQWVTFDTTSGSASARPVTAFTDGEASVEPASADLATGEDYIWSNTDLEDESSLTTNDNFFDYTVNESTGVLTSSEEARFDTNQINAWLDQRKKRLKTQALENISINTLGDLSNIRDWLDYMDDVDSLTTGDPDPTEPSASTVASKFIDRIWRRDNVNDTVETSSGDNIGGLVTGEEFIDISDGYNQICFRIAAGPFGVIQVIAGTVQCRLIGERAVDFQNVWEFDNVRYYIATGLRGQSPGYDFNVGVRVENKAVDGFDISAFNTSNNRQDVWVDYVCVGLGAEPST